MQAVDQLPPGWAPGQLTPAAEPLSRLLGPWGVPPVAPAPLARRLGDWLGWADAIALSQVLAASPAPAGSGNSQAALEWATAALDRLQAELLAGFADPELAAESAQPLPDTPVPLADLLAPYRLHHAQQQRAIAAKVASLRERLRGRLAEASPALARLATLDAVFDRALAAQERQLLGGLPALLTRRADLHHAAEPRHWRARLWADLQRLLAAELDQRLQPVLGLLDALNSEDNAPR